jgi:hypothetical protein
LYQRGSADVRVVIDVSPRVAGCHVVPHDVAFHHGCRILLSAYAKLLTDTSG